jgi:hypothetical protein
MFVNIPHDHLGSTLVLSKKTARLQYMDEHTATLTECCVPCMGSIDSEKAIIIDDFMLKFKSFRIDNGSTIILDEKVHYEYEEGEVIDWSMEHITKYGFLFITNDISLVERDIQVVISFDKNYFCIDDECGTLIKFPFQSTKKFNIGSQKFNSSYIIDSLLAHVGSYCQISLGDDQPICFEFPGEHRIFIAPIIKT